MLICHPVTSRPLICQQKKQFYLPITSRPPIWQLAFWSFISLELRDPWNGGPFRNAPTLTLQSLLFLFPLFFFVSRFSLLLFISRFQQKEKSLLFSGCPCYFFAQKKARIGGSGKPVWNNQVFPKNHRKIHPKIFNWTRFAEQFPLGYWLVSQGRRQSSREVFENVRVSAVFLGYFGILGRFIESFQFTLWNFKALRSLRKIG